MTIAAFLFAQLDHPDSIGRPGGTARSVRARRGPVGENDADAQDVALATRVQAGDVEDARIALETLYSAHRLSLWQFAWQFTSSEDTAHDAVHDVFAAIWIRRASWQVVGSVRAYLYGAVRNRAVELLRAGARRQDLLVEHFTHSADAHIAVDAEVQELELAVQRAVDRLPERQRTALLLFWHESMNMSEIGRVLGITPAASRKLLLTAQGTLRKVVEKFF